MMKSEKHNTDILGTKWKLAPGGRKLIGQFQSSTGKMSFELLACAALFKNMKSFEINDEELYGLSLVLESMSKRLKRASDNVAKSISEDKE